MYAASMMRAAIYARLSSDPRGRGKSVAEQEADARADVERQGWELVEVFVDNNRSASKYARRDREAFSRLVAGVEAKRFDVIVAWEASRFVRDTKVYADLADACVRTGTRYSYNGRVLDLSDPDDAFNAGLDALLSEREAGITRKRIMRTHRFNAEAGLPHGQIPYGYRRVYDDRTGALLRQEPDPVEAVIVREIFHRIAAGESLRTIVRSLTTRRVVTPSGGSEWSAVSLRRILNRRAYLGKRLWNGRVMEAGGWEPLVDELLFDRCQAILADPRRRQYQKDAAVRHLLTGILQCDECDQRMSVGPRNGIPSYVCRAGHVGRAKALVDSPVERLVLALLRDPRMAAGAGDPEHERLTEEVRRLDHAVAALVDRVVSGELTALIATAEQRRLEARQAEIGLELRRLAPLPDVVQNASGPGAESTWAAMSLEDQRTVVRALFSSLRAVKKKGQTQVGRRAPGVLYVLARDPSQTPTLLGA